MSSYYYKKGVENSENIQGKLNKIILDKHLNNLENIKVNKNYSFW